MSNFGPIPQAGSIQAPIIQQAIASQSKTARQPNQMQILFKYRHVIFRRVYVGNLPGNAVEIELRRYIRETFQKLGGLLQPGDPIHQTLMNIEKRYVFLEIRSPQETTAILKLDGLPYKNSRLKFRRPSEFDKQPKVELSLPIPQINPYSIGIVATMVAEGQNKVYFGGFPNEWTEIDAIKLIQSFAKLKSFYLLRDRQDGPTKGYGFGQFLHPHQADNAIAQLTSYNIAHDKRLKVQRCTTSSTHAALTSGMRATTPMAAPLPSANPGYHPPAAMYGGVTKAPMGYQTIPITPNVAPYQIIQNLPPLTSDQRELWARLFESSQGFKVSLCTNKILTPQEIQGNEYWDFFEDIKREFEKFGRVKRLVIPKINHVGFKAENLGKIYIQYEDMKAAMAAIKLLSGRQYSGRDLEVMYYDEDKMNRNQFT